ncbi:hypothetical protein ACWCV9_03710 [Streptomyces sp. NPDC001606]
MVIQPWGAALDDAEWQTRIADGHDVGILSANGLPGRAPAPRPGPCALPPRPPLPGTDPL